MSNIIFSVVTPTYNRANLLDRVFTSLKKQDFSGFEWIVIDDGSTDNTEDKVCEFSNRANFKITYVKTENNGKASALNESISYCSGELYLVFDSDDWCDSKALSKIYSEYLSLKARRDFEEYGALSCLKRGRDGLIIGDNYNKLSKYGLTYIDRINKGVKGDKWECLITKNVIDYKYPVQNNEKYMAPGYVWLKLANLGLKTVFINEALSTIEYQNDGISKNNFSNRYRSRETSVIYYKEAFNARGLSFFSKSKYYINYVRFCLHCNKGFDFIFPYFILFPFAFLLKKRDLKFIKSN